MSERAEEKFSVLTSLKERRTEILEEQVLTLPVPRWTNPEIYVKYRPVEHHFIRAAQDRVAKAPKGSRYEMEVDGNADILVRGCVGVVAVIDDQEFSLRPDDPHGDPTLFDADLAANLGLGDRATARQVVRELFVTEGDILSASQSLVQWSGYKETEADTTLRGE